MNPWLKKLYWVAAGIAVFGVVWHNWNRPATETEAVLRQIEEVRQTKAKKGDSKDADKLKEILKKVKADTPLSPEEKKFLAGKEGMGEKVREETVLSRERGQVTIFAPVGEWSVGARLGVGIGGCHVTDLATVRLSDGREFETGPTYQNNFGQLPEGTVFRYRSRTGERIRVECINMTLIT